MNKFLVLLAMSIFMACASMSWAAGEGRMPNPGWSFIKQIPMDSIVVVFGANPSVSGCKIQSKWHRIDRTGRPNPGAQVVITNPGPGCDIGSSRVTSALSRAKSLGPIECPQNDCGVVEH